MAGKSKKTKVVPLHSKDKNGKITYTYYTAKNMSLKDKLQRKKHNPVTGKHELFVEGKVQKSS